MNDDNHTNLVAVQSAAITTLVGIVAYLTHELAHSGTLNIRSFHKHLDDLGAPDSLSESVQEKNMRESILKVIRNAAGEGENDAAES